MALFFLAGATVIGQILPSTHGFAGILGGPTNKIQAIEAGKNELALLYSVPNPTIVAFKTNQTKEFAGIDYILSDSIEGPNLNPTANGYVDYKISKGDTLSGIAKNFGISIETISTANPKIRGRALKPGEILKILPVTGFVYILKEGESVEGVASKYGLSISQLSDFNSGTNIALAKEGSAIIIPGNPKDTEKSDLPDVGSYFSSPAEGLNWGSSHNFNAVDIANVCGTEVISSADGLVTEVGAVDQNNGGYGGYVLIEHTNGTKTKYGHLGKISVGIGEYVKKGGKIGEMGNSGTVHGPSGCHLHFEVHGAQNPFRKI